MGGKEVGAVHMPDLETANLKFLSLGKNCKTLEIAYK